MAPKNKKSSGMISVNQTVADNRKAFFDYEIEEKFEAGLALVGTEVKSLRLGQCSLKEAYVGSHQGEMMLINCHIPEYQQAGPKLQHEPTRMRKVLLKQREIDKLLGAVSREGYAILPLRLYFNGRGLAKLEIGLGKGKKQYDKRETKKQRDWNREKQRLLKTQN